MEPAGGIGDGDWSGGILSPACEALKSLRTGLACEGDRKVASAQPGGTVQGSTDNIVMRWYDRARRNANCLGACEKQHEENVFGPISHWFIEPTSAQSYVQIGSEASDVVKPFSPESVLSSAISFNFPLFSVTSNILIIKWKGSSCVNS